MKYLIEIMRAGLTIVAFGGIMWFNLILWSSL